MVLFYVRYDYSVQREHQPQYDPSEYDGVSIRFAVGMTNSLAFGVVTRRIFEQDLSRVPPSETMSPTMEDSFVR